MMVQLPAVLIQLGLLIVLLVAAKLGLSALYIAMSAAGLFTTLAYVFAVRHWLTGRFDQRTSWPRLLASARACCPGSLPRCSPPTRRGSSWCAPGTSSRQAFLPWRPVRSPSSSASPTASAMSGRRSCCCATRRRISPRRNDACSRSTRRRCSLRRRGSAFSRRSCLRFYSARRSATAFTMCRRWPSPIACSASPTTSPKGCRPSSARGTMPGSGRPPPPCFSPFACRSLAALGRTASSPPWEPAFSPCSCCCRSYRSG